jgi:hypothetical protein
MDASQLFDSPEDPRPKATGKGRICTFKLVPFRLIVIGADRTKVLHPPTCVFALRGDPLEARNDAVKMDSGQFSFGMHLCDFQNPIELHVLKLFGI